MNDMPARDTSTEPAKERTYTAYENNLMAWIRTALSPIGFGIGIFEVAQRTGGNAIFRSLKLVGLLLVLLGVVAVLVAIQENKKIVNSYYILKFNTSVILHWPKRSVMHWL